MRLMESAAGRVFGGKVRLEFSFGHPRKDRGAAQQDANAIEEATEDPVVRKVLDMFGGEIRELKREE